MTPSELEKAVLGIKRWSRGDQRAPNKPLMMAYAIARYIQGHGQMFSYETEVELEVKELLQRFGPSRKSYHPLYPFWRLINDGFWRLDNAETCLPRKSNTDPPKTELIRHHVTGGFSDEAFTLLTSDTQFAIGLLERVLTESFPESVVAEITNHLGLEFTFKGLQRRDPNFRKEVLRAYNYKCAVCGYDLRMDDISVGLEAAHIKWKQFHGPCTVNNGIALCSIHHKAFDKGALGFTDDFKIMLSPSLNGGELVQRLFFDFDEKQILLPRNLNLIPSNDFIQWHKSEVFKIGMK